jgi:CubicO group peptidase (beta-lactamase class C family)
LLFSVPHSDEPYALAEFLEKYPTVPANFQSAQTPEYSNAGISLLGIALERITGMPMAEMYDQNLISTLGLKGTSYTIPNTTYNAVIPGNNISVGGWNTDFGPTSP